MGRCAISAPCPGRVRWRPPSTIPASSPAGGRRVPPRASASLSAGTDRCTRSAAPPGPSIARRSPSTRAATSWERRWSRSPRATSPSFIATASSTVSPTSCKTPRAGSSTSPARSTTRDRSSERAGSTAKGTRSCSRRDDVLPGGFPVVSVVSIWGRLVRRLIGTHRRNHEIPHVRAPFRVVSRVPSPGGPDGGDGQLRGDIPQGRHARRHGRPLAEQGRRSRAPQERQDYRDGRPVHRDQGGHRRLGYLEGRLEGRGGPDRNRVHGAAPQALARIRRRVGAPADVRPGDGTVAVRSRRGLPVPEPAQTRLGGEALVGPGAIGDHALRVIECEPLQRKLLAGAQELGFGKPGTGAKRAASAGAEPLPPGKLRRAHFGRKGLEAALPRPAREERAAQAGIGQLSSVGPPLQPRNLRRIETRPADERRWRRLARARRPARSRPRRRTQRLARVLRLQIRELERFPARPYRRRKRLQHPGPGAVLVEDPRRRRHHRLGLRRAQHLLALRALRGPAHVDERHGERTEGVLGAGMQERDLGVVGDPPLAVPLEDPADADHAASVQLGRAQGAHARASVDHDAGVDRIEDLVLPDAGLRFENPVDERDRVGPMAAESAPYVALSRRRQDGATRLGPGKRGAQKCHNLHSNSETRRPGTSTLKTGSGPGNSTAAARRQPSARNAPSTPPRTVGIRAASRFPGARAQARRRSRAAARSGPVTSSRAPWTSVRRDCAASSSAARSASCGRIAQAYPAVAGTGPSSRSMRIAAATGSAPDRSKQCATSPWAPSRSQIAETLAGNIPGAILRVRIAAGFQPSGKAIANRPRSAASSTACKSACGLRRCAPIPFELQRNGAGPSEALPGGGQCTACAATSTVAPEVRSRASIQAMRSALEKSRGAATSAESSHALCPSSRAEANRSSDGTRSAAHSSAASESADARASSQLSPFPFEIWSTCPPGRTAQATSTPARSSPVTRATRVTPRAGSSDLTSCSATSATASRRLDRGDVDLLHAHHRVKRALCFIAAGREGLGQHARRDLPGDAPLVFAPAARALLTAIADDSVPVAVRLLLIVGGDLEQEGFVMVDIGTAV